MPMPEITDKELIKEMAVSMFYMSIAGEEQKEIIDRLVSALEQCKLEVEQFRRLSYGGGVFPPSKGMEMAEAILKEVRGDA